MILLDTSVLVAAFCSPHTAAPALRRTIREGHPVIVTSLVLYEWWRGPRQRAEIEAVELTFPPNQFQGFGPAEAARAAELYRQVKSPRRREMDLAIAACAIEWEAQLWTLNPADFTDIPGLRLWAPGAA